MAKLEDKIKPHALLLAIRSGRFKDELVGEYRTTVEELAMMLLPLYREGKLSKEEFNNFFQGKPLSGEPESTADLGPPPPQANYNEPPTEFFKVFTSVFSRKRSSEEVREPEPPPLVTTSQPDAVNDTASQSGELSLQPEMPLDSTLGTVDIDTDELAQLAEDQPKNVEAEFCLLDDASAAALDVSSQKLVSSTSLELSSSKGQIEKIVNILDAIDNRLSRIERKLGLE